MSSQVNHTFSQYNFAILANSKDVRVKLSEMVTKRGARSHVFADISDISDVIYDQHFDILIFHQEGFNENEIIDLIEKFREKKPSPVLIWTISDSILPLADGFTPLSFKPSELLKPIYFSLLIHEDLHASA